MNKRMLVLCAARLTRIALIFITFAALMFICTESRAAFTYGQWRELPESWRLGYLYAVMDVSGAVVMSAGQEDGMRMVMSYRKCMGGGKLTDGSFSTAVEAYIRKHPEAITDQFIGVTFNVLSEICRPYFKQE